MDRTAEVDGTEAVAAAGEPTGEVELEDELDEGEAASPLARLPLPPGVVVRTEKRGILCVLAVLFPCAMAGLVNRVYLMCSVCGD